MFVGHRNWPGERLGKSGVRAGLAQRLVRKSPERVWMIMGVLWVKQGSFPQKTKVFPRKEGGFPQVPTDSRRDTTILRRFTPTIWGTKTRRPLSVGDRGLWKTCGFSDLLVGRMCIQRAKHLPGKSGCFFYPTGL